MDQNMNERERFFYGVAVAHFGREPISVTETKPTPFSSLRLHFPDQTVIATQRKSFRRTHLEAIVLEQLSQVCDDVPAYLGMTDGILFQSDLGDNRLHNMVQEHDQDDQLELAAEACASIFRFQNAAQQTGLVNSVPHIGTSGQWLQNLVGAVDALQMFSCGIPDDFDTQDVIDFLSVQPHNFVKWHSRPAYAMVCDDGFLRWHGFEMCGVRHGAEDLAWFIGDETWPVDPEKMMQVVVDTYYHQNEIDLDSYLEYLSVYTAFHCVQRFKLILHEVQKTGWRETDCQRRKELPGVDVQYAHQLCKVGAFFADRSPLTQKIVPNFEQSARVIAAIPS